MPLIVIRVESGKGHGGNGEDMPRPLALSQPCYVSHLPVLLLLTLRCTHGCPSRRILLRNRPLRPDLLPESESLSLPLFSLVSLSAASGLLHDLWSMIATESNMKLFNMFTNEIGKHQVRFNFWFWSLSAVI
jgi:hypothetical protein